MILCIRTTVLILLLALAAQTGVAQHISGELKVWHPVTLTVSGPQTSETADPNPFTDYRLNLTFTNGDHVYVVPGFYAADGNAGETGATVGNVWKVHFTPDKAGTWTYLISFQSGPDIAISNNTGQPLEQDGMTGLFEVLPSDKTGDDFRAKGRLAYVNRRYLQHQGSGEYFLKTGADSPETLLATADFDQTYLLSSGAPLKSWQPHVHDWKEGDPVWRDTLGKGIIGAVNYLAEEGQNAISFLTMNINGDGDNVWPFADPDVRDRYDCSKLDQWEVLFAHCDKLGIALHFKTQEQENDQLLDNGELGRYRKLYYRELIARFGHHLGVTWNLGEENTNQHAQRIAFAQYFHSVDPYHHPIVVHTFPDDDDYVFNALIGDKSKLTGASLQGNWEHVHALTMKWVNESEKTGKPWVVANDEQGLSFIGVPNDGFLGQPDQFDIRRSVLWGNLMAGGAGVEYYFGYALPHNDLNCEDFRSRDRTWDDSRYAREFFENHLSFAEMHNADSLLVNRSDYEYCFAQTDSVYVIYTDDGDPGIINFSQVNGTYSVSWYDPVSGGELQKGSIDSISGQGQVSIGSPPSTNQQDWVILLRRATGNQQSIVIEATPAGCGSALLVWKNSVGWSNPVIEVSTDGMLFTTLSSSVVVTCGSTCSVKVPVKNAMTWFRLRNGSRVSTVAACHMPCFLSSQIYPLKPTLSGQ